MNYIISPEWKKVLHCYSLKLKDETLEKNFQTNFPNLKIPVSGKWEATNIWRGKKFKAALSTAVDDEIKRRENKDAIDINDIVKNTFLAIFEILNLFKLKINKIEGITHKRILINEPLEDKFVFK